MTMTLVETVTLGSSAASILFSSIPQTGTDLLLVTSLRTDEAGETHRLVSVYLNPGTGDFTYRYLSGDGSTASSGSNTTTQLSWAIWNPATLATSNTFGSSSTYIPNYTITGNKSLSSENASENNATATRMGLNAGLWSGTAAITSIRLNSTGLFVAGSTASLYTITKGSGGATVS